MSLRCAVTGLCSLWASLVSNSGHLETGSQSMLLYTQTDNSCKEGWI